MSWIDKKNECGESDDYNYLSVYPQKIYYKITNEKKFLDIYSKKIKKSKQYILEKFPENSPLSVCVDLKQSENADENLKYVIKLYQKNIALITDTHDIKLLNCIVLKKNDTYYLLFRDFIVKSNTVEYLREKVIEEIKSSNIFIGQNIRRKPVLLYGSCYNPDDESYVVYDIFDHECHSSNESVLKLKSSSSTPSFLSIRNKEQTSILKRMAYILKNEKPRIKIQQIRSKESIVEDLQLIKNGDLLFMISDERVNSLEHFIEIGKILFDIGQGEIEALDFWLELSERVNNYVEGFCEKFWYSFKISNKTINSLLNICKNDSPNSYEEWKNDNVNYLIDESLKAPKPNHLDVAKIVCKMYQGRFVCSHEKKDKWYEFRGHRWYQIENSNIKKLIANEVISKYEAKLQELNNKIDKLSKDDPDRSVLCDKYVMCQKIILSLKSAPYHDGVLTMCKLYMSNSNFDKLVNQDMKLWVFENGVYDLESCMFREGSPDDFCTHSCGQYYIRYDSNDKDMIELDNFLNKVFPNTEIRKYFMKMLCLAVSGRNSHKIFGCCTGTGNNGKSVTFDLIATAFGDYYMNLPREFFIGPYNSSSKARPELSRTKGKRLVVFQEVPKDEKINIGVLKEMTGNDRFYARGLYEEGDEIKPMFTLMLQCNDPPKIPGHDQATWNRVRVILFESLFDANAPFDKSEQFRQKHFTSDPYISDELKSLASALIYKILSFYKDYKEEEWFDPPEIVKPTNEYHSDNDIYSQFVNENISLDNNSSIRLMEMYNEFKYWYNTNHPSYKNDKIDRNTMKKEISKKLKVKYENNRWIGCKLNHDERNDKNIDVGSLLTN